MLSLRTAWQDLQDMDRQLQWLLVALLAVGFVAMTSALRGLL